jgi:hypothetical protein
MTCIERELSTIRERNWPITKVSVDFLKKLWWHLLNGNSSTIWEGTRLLLKSSSLILLAQNSGDIYWMGFFHEKRTNLTDYEELPIDFIDRKSWLDLLKRNSSTIRKQTWPFTKDSWWILLSWNWDENYWMKFLPSIKEGTWPITKKSCSILLAMSSDVIFIMIALPR